ncbi:hypothetical protein IGK21_002627 [Enterococcus sp. DIV1421a]
MYLWSICTISISIIFFIINIYLLLQDYKYIITSKISMRKLSINGLLIISTLILLGLGISSIFIINNQL